MKVTKKLSPAATAAKAKPTIPKNNLKHVGILPGSFDPVHEGHLAFALAAAQVLGLEKVWLMPEAKPLSKPKITPLDKRLEMLKVAIKDHKNLDVLDIGDEQFSVESTLPKLQTEFKNTELYILLGSDIAKGINKWAGAKKLKQKMKIVSAAREDKKLNQDFQTIFTAFGDVSSSKIRSSIAKGELPQGLPEALLTYIKKNRLYAS